MTKTLAEVFAELERSTPLTADDVRQAIKALPAHRRDLRGGLKRMLALVQRGITVNSNSPLWGQAQNVIAVSKVDVDFDTDGRAQ